MAVISVLRLDRPRRTNLRTALLVAALGLALVACVDVARADLFSLDGRQTTRFGEDFHFGNAMAIQPDGRIVVAGSAYQGDDDFALARYRRDGTLDRSFSEDGRQTTAFTRGEDEGRGVAIQTDGKIVVAGSLEREDQDYAFALARYNRDGSLDRSFSSDGKQATDFGSGSDKGQAVAIQADGKIVVAGSADPIEEEDDDFAVARYNRDGSLDRSFGEDGTRTTDLGGREEEAAAVAIQADGKIVVVGDSEQSDTYFDFALVRYRRDGTLDSSFSGDGKQTTDFGGYDPGRAVAIQGDGKIVVAGTAEGSDDTYLDFALARYDSDGTLDASFSRDGKQTLDFRGEDDEGQAVALANGKIVIAGSSADVRDGQENVDFALARYRSDGTLDRSFSGDGKQTTDFLARGSADEARAAAIQADGKIVLAGDRDRDLFALARFKPGGRLDGQPGNSILRGLALDPARFSATRRNGIPRSRVGTRLFFRLTAPTLVRFRVERPEIGRPVGRRCLKPLRGSSEVKRCMRWVAMRGSFSRSGARGRNAFPYAGRLRGRALPPGRYRLVAVLPELADRLGPVARAGFRVVGR